MKSLTTTRTQHTHTILTGKKEQTKESPSFTLVIPELNWLNLWELPHCCNCYYCLLNMLIATIIQLMTSDGESGDCLLLLFQNEIQKLTNTDCCCSLHAYLFLRMKLLLLLLSMSRCTMLCTALILRSKQSKQSWSKYKQASRQASTHTQSLH